MTLVFGSCLASAADPLETWAERYIGQGITGVAFGGERFVAVGDAFYDSPDGMCWVRRTSDPSPDDLWGVAYGNGRFVAVESGRSRVESHVFVSTNGMTWQVGLRLPAHYGPVTDRVYFGGGTFLTVGKEVNPNPSSTSRSYHWLLMTSTDGFNWVRHSGPTNSPQWEYLGAATYGNGLYLAGGWSGGDLGEGLLVASTNLADWAPVTGFPFSPINGLAFGDGLFVAVGSTNTAISSDGFRWTNQVTEIFPVGRSAVTFGAGTFIAVRGRMLLSSTNGMDWTPHPTTVDTLMSVTYGKDCFMAVGGYYYGAYPYGMALQSGGNPQMCLEAIGLFTLPSYPSFRLTIKAAGQFRLQYSPLLPDASWTDLRTNVARSPRPWTFYDSAATNTGQRFYRLVSP